MSKLHQLILSACGAALIAVAPMAVQVAQPAAQEARYRCAGLHRNHPAGSSQDDGSG